MHSSALPGRGHLQLVDNQFCAMPCWPAEASAIEAVQTKVRAWLDEQGFSFRNQWRTNLLLELMTSELAGTASLREYQRRIRTACSGPRPRSSAPHQSTREPLYPAIRGCGRGDRPRRTLGVRMTELWTCDSTVLWGLACEGLLDPARKLFPKGLHVTDAIRGELLRHVDERQFLRDAIAAIDDGRLPVVELTPEELKRVFMLRRLWGCSPRDRNNFGEAEVVAVTVERGGGAVIDDHRASMTMKLKHSDRPILDTPELLLNLSDSGHCSRDAAWTHLENMKKVGGFDHPMSKMRKTDYLSGKFYTPRTRI